MPQSTMLQLLMQLQADLNRLTIDCVEANSTLTDLLELYNGKVHRRSAISPKVSRWTEALNAMSDSLDKFQSDAAKLEEYLNAQG
jgi:hypothetical protein